MNNKALIGNFMFQFQLRTIFVEQKILVCNYN